jgi:antitoxin component of MazEF toxin-antitoxin module
MADDEMELHDTRKVREDGGSVVVTIPPEVVERSGIELGEDVRFGTVEGGEVALIPWGEDRIRELLDMD